MRLQQYRFYRFHESDCIDRTFDFIALIIRFRALHPNIDNYQEIVVTWLHQLRSRSKLKHRRLFSNKSCIHGTVARSGKNIFVVDTTVRIEGEIITVPVSRTLFSFSFPENIA